MDIRRLIAATAIFFSTMAYSTEEHAFKNAKEAILFEDTALTMCLGMGYDGKSRYFSDQFSQATGGYVEFSNISLDAYDDLRTVIKGWLAKGYRAKNGVENIAMKCIDLSRSEAVRAIYELHDPCKSRDAWLDDETYALRCN